MEKLDEGLKTLLDLGKRHRRESCFVYTLVLAHPQLLEMATHLRQLSLDLFHFRRDAVRKRSVD